MASAGTDVTSRIKYEFTKSFLISAEASFASLDGQSELSKKIESGFEFLAAAVTVFAGRSGGAVARSPKYAVRPFDEIKQLQNKMYAIATISPQSSKDFHEIFRKLFITTGVQVYHTYRNELKDVYLVSFEGAERKEDHLQAIQILASYAGSCCFERLLSEGTMDTTGKLVKALVDKSVTKKVKSFWKLWTTDALHIIPQSTKPWEPKEVSIAAYKFFQKTALIIPVHYSDYLIRDEFTHETTAMTPNNEAEIFYRELMNDRSYSKNDALWVKILEVHFKIDDVKTECVDINTNVKDVSKRLDSVGLSVQELSTMLQNFLITVQNQSKTSTIDQNPQKIEVPANIRKTVQEIQLSRNQNDINKNYQLADNLRAQGNHADAAHIYSAILLKKFETLGPNSDDTLWAKHNLAEEYAALGKHLEAAKLFLDISFRKDLNKGFADEETKYAKNNLGDELSQLLKLKDASGVVVDILKEEDQILEPDHSDRLYVKYVLAEVLAKKGEHEEASKLFADMLERKSRIFKGEPDHADILFAKHNLAFELSSLGKHKEAADLFQEVYDSKLKLHGDDHQDTKYAKGNLDKELRKL